MSVSAASIKRDDLLEDVPETFAFKPPLESHSFYSSSEMKVTPLYLHSIEMHIEVIIRNH